MGLVPATSPCNKSKGLVASCELTNFATKSTRRDQNLNLATSPTNSNWFEFVGIVAGTKVDPCDQILKQFTRCDWSLRLAAGTSRREEVAETCRRDMFQLSDPDVPRTFVEECRFPIGT